MAWYSTVAFYDTTWTALVPQGSHAIQVFLCVQNAPQSVFKWGVRDMNVAQADVLRHIETALSKGLLQSANSAHSA